VRLLLPGLYAYELLLLRIEVFEHVDAVEHLVLGLGELFTAVVLGDHRRAVLLHICPPLYLVLHLLPPELLHLRRCVCVLGSI
jgi:hypothetical protein